jgi:hypothetical protein
LAKYRKPHQTPYTHAEPLEKLHLILVPKFATTADLGPLKLDALQAETNGDLETAEQLWWRVIAVLPVDPQAHEAIKRITLKQMSPSPTGVPDVATAPTARQAEPRHPPYIWPTRLTRRQALGATALAAAGAGAVIAAPAIRRLMSKPSVQTISFDVTSVDKKGARAPLSKYTATAFAETLGSNAKLDMVSIPGGGFTMGSPADEQERRANEGPQHYVTLASFFIGAWPVTQAQWAAVVLAHPNRVHSDLDPKPSFFRVSICPPRALRGTTPKNFVCVSPRSPGDPTACRARPNGNMPAALVPLHRLTSVRRSLKNWPTIVEPGALYAVKAGAKASPQLSTTA